MINKLLGKSKLTGKLALVFLILLAIIFVFNFSSFRTLNTAAQYQQQIAHSYQQLLLLKKLENAVHLQIHFVLQTLVQEKKDLKEFEVHRQKVFDLFLQAEKFSELNTQHESRNITRELNTLNELEADYSRLITRLEIQLAQPDIFISSEKIQQINKLIDEGFKKKFQNYLTEVQQDEKEELANINKKASDNIDQEFILAWVLIGLSICFSYIAYRNLKSTTVSKNELIKINQSLEKEIAKTEKAESQAKDERQNLYNILDSLPMAFHLQAQDYSIPFANKVFRERFGEVQNQHCYKLMHDRSEPCEVCTTFKVFDQEKNVNSIWDSQDGKTYLTVCTPFTDMDGSPLVMEMALDITDQENAKRQAQLAMTEAKEANLAKSKFLANMSHELRTPLNSILGFSQLLQLDSKNPLKPMQDENVERILKAGAHLLELINEVLDLSKIESGALNLNTGNVSLSYLIKEVHELLEPMATKNNINFEYVLDEDQSIRVLADRMRLKQALLNLASNAIKYNRPNGKIKIFYNKSQDEKIKISVSDTGLGIKKEDLKRIFEPFHRVQSSSQSIEGTGIGLAISEQLIISMQGRIDVESELGKGSCFSITLPEGDANINSEKPAPPELTTLGKRSNNKNYKILYIEDNLANMELVGSALFRPNINFLQAPDARVGIDIAKAHRPDLILIDINLPGMDGFEALRVIREDPSIGATPIFALSANNLESDIQRGLTNGFDEYIPKPIQISNFIEKVNSVLK